MAYLSQRKTDITVNIMGENMTIIDVANDFTKFPIGRSKKIFKNRSGEAFREDHLIPALKKMCPGEKIQIKLDGTSGYNPSFLDEAFAGLIRKHSYSKNDILDTIEFVTQDEFLKKEIISYMDDAERDA